MLQGHQRQDELLSDYCDGSVFRSHPLFSSPSKYPSLEIIAYYDDVEVCNPLGSRAKKHKLGTVSFRVCALFRISNLTALFYYTLGNISPKYRSTLRCVQLLAVLKSNQLQEYGVSAVLQPFMEDLCSIEHVSVFLVQSSTMYWVPPPFLKKQDDGVTFTISGHSYTFRGTLALVPGDNLASHYLGGWLQVPIKCSA